LLGDTDPRRRTRVEVQLAATANPWQPAPGPGRVPGGSGPLTAEQAEDRFIELRARHDRLAEPGHVDQRLAVADEAMALAEAVGNDTYLAWASMWRTAGFYQRGDRIGLNAEFMRLNAVARRLNEPVWSWRVTASQAVVALLEARYDDAVARNREARAQADACGHGEGVYLDLVLRSSLAIQAGTDISDVECEVREVLREAPFFAHGWRAQLLVAMGRVDEARQIWSALANHIDAVPRHSPEWLVAATGHANLALLAGDRRSADRLYEMLLPLANLHVSGGPLTPYEGPVALYLGRLAQVRDDPRAARTHLEAAARSAESMYAPWFVRAARDALVDLAEPAGPLSAREYEVAAMVASGQSNREIAAALSLSERTVENHVSSILRKLDLRSRSAVAAWFTAAQPAARRSTAR
jgi:DNA-binding CsgD family transcriptional regulator